MDPLMRQLEKQKENKPYKTLVDLKKLVIMRQVRSDAICLFTYVTCVTFITLQHCKNRLDLLKDLTLHLVHTIVPIFIAYINLEND
jgi:hypothetical protein